MTKYYTLTSALMSAGINNRIEWKDKFSFFKNSSLDAIGITVEAALSSEWKIIPAAPVAVCKMTFFEAYEKAKDGERVREGTNWITKGVSRLREFNFSAAYFLQKDWYIEPAGPVVLTVDEWCEKEDLDEHSLQSAFEAGTKNGELKERQNLQPLIDAMEKGGRNLTEWYEKVWAAYQNIKPLTGD